MKKSQNFNNWVHSFGIISSLVLLVAMTVYPVIISIIYGVWPDLKQLWPGIVAVILFMAPWWPGETIGYMSIMGPGALYMSYITGNVTNLRMPATVGTINVLGIEPNSEKCHTMAIIVCGASIITSVAVLTLGVVLTVPLKPVLELESLQPAFNYVVPALFGGLVAQTVLKGTKKFLMWLIPLAICLYCSYFTTMNSAHYIFQENKGRYGARRIQLVLERQGIKVNHKRVSKLMSAHGLIAKGTRKTYRKARKGNPYDNSIIEPFYRTLKKELVQDVDYDNPEQARQDIFRYIELYYNTERIHSALGWLSPVQFEIQNT